MARLFSIILAASLPVSLEGRERTLSKRSEALARRLDRLNRLCAITASSRSVRNFPHAPMAMAAHSDEPGPQLAKRLGDHRVYFPRMIEEPGLDSGSMISPIPQRGPEPSQRMSLAIFIKAYRYGLKAELLNGIPCSWASK